MFGGPISLSLGWRGRTKSPEAPAPGPVSPSPSPSSVAGRRDPYRPFFTVPRRVLTCEAVDAYSSPLSRSPPRRSGATLDIFSLRHRRSASLDSTHNRGRACRPSPLVCRWSARSLPTFFSLFRAASSTCDVAVDAHSSPSHALLIAGPGRSWTFFLFGLVDSASLDSRHAPGRARRPFPPLSLAGAILTDPFSLFRAAPSTREVGVDAHSSPLSLSSSAVGVDLGHFFCTRCSVCMAGGAHSWPSVSPFTPPLSPLDADGTPIARLSRGPHGGSFELFDDRGEARATPTKDTGSKGYVLDEGDPWRAPVAPSDRPAAGF